jgi:hypothetical protein
MNGRAGVMRFLGVLTLVLLAACAKVEPAAPMSGPAAAGLAAADGGPASTQGGAQAAQQASRTLAYEHTVVVELKPQDLSVRTREVQKACESRVELGCTLLDIQIDEESAVPSARITMRLAPGQVDPMIDIAARGGRILSRKTHAEDLAQPMADTERQIALLSMHRDRLSEFLNRKDLEVKQVIELSREISSTQTDIENLTAQKANLRRRVDTERLSLRLSPPGGAYESAETPIRNALRSFGSDFATTLSVLIRFFAVILPVLLAVALAWGLWLLIHRLIARRAGS